MANEFNVKKGLIVTGSAHITADVTASAFTLEGSGQNVLLDDGTTAATSSIQTALPDGTVSGSSQINYPDISNIPSGIVSGSDQVSGSFVLKSGDTVSGNLVISGDLIVNGTTTYISSSVVDIGDNIINLNYGGSQTNGGIYVADATGGSTESGSLLWDGTLDYWKAGTLGNETKILLAGGDGVVSGSSQIDHDTTTNFVADEHIAHSGVSISAGLGLSGGGDITTTRTLTLDTGSTHFQDGVSAVAPALPSGTVSGSSQIDHNATANYTASRHTDHSNVTITAGDGLTGGGDITISRTLNVGAGDGISVATDSISVDGTVLRTTGDNVFTGSSQVVHDSTTGFVANEHIDHSGVSITAGSGLTGGGDITTTRTLDVGQGDGISVTADAIAVDSTVLRTGTGVVSGSSQVDLTQTTNYVSGIKTRLDAEGVISGSSQITSLGFLQNVVEDTTPQLGGNLDLNTNNISGSGLIDIVGSISGSSGIRLSGDSINLVRTSEAQFDKALNIFSTDMTDTGTAQWLQITIGSASQNNDAAEFSYVQGFGDSAGTRCFSLGLYNNQFIEMYRSGSTDRINFLATEIGVVARTGQNHIITYAKPVFTTGGSPGTGPVSVIIDASNSTDTNPSRFGVSGMNSGTETGQMEFGDAWNSIVSTYNSGMALRSYHPMYFYGGRSNTTPFTGGSTDYPSDSTLAYHFQITGDKSFVIEGNTASPTNNVLEVKDNLSSNLLSLDGTGNLILSSSVSASSFIVDGNTGGQNFLLDDGNTVATSSYLGGGGLSNVVEDTTPQLGGNLDLNGNTISGSTGGIDIAGTISGSVFKTDDLYIQNYGLITNRGANPDRITFYPSASKTTNFLEVLNDPSDSDIFVFELQAASDAVFRGWRTSLYFETDDGNNSTAYPITFSPNEVNLLTLSSGSTYNIQFGDDIFVTGSVSASAFIVGNTGQYALLDNGTLVLTSSLAAGGGLANVVEDTTPQLGGNLDTNGFAIGSALTDSHVISGSLTLRVSGSTVFDILGSQGQLFSITDDLTGDIFGVGDIAGDTILNVNSAGVVTVNNKLEITGSLYISGGIGQNALLDNGTLVATSSLGGGIADIVSDTTPQLGGNLDLNSYTISGSGDIDINGYVTASRALFDGGTGNSQVVVRGINTGTSSIAYITFTDSDNTLQSYIGSATQTNNDFQFANVTTDKYLILSQSGELFYNNGSTSRVVYHAGNFGINVDTTPQLGGTLDMNGNDISGSGIISASAYYKAGGDGTSLLLDDGTTALTSSLLASGSGITDLVQDTTPQLGGYLDTNGFPINNAFTDSLVISGSVIIEASGSTVFEIQGSQGQLFAITDDLTGDIFSVGDISGDPILNVNASGVVSISDKLEVTGSIEATGDITAFASSDERLKLNMTPIPEPLEKLVLITGYEYDWNESKQKDKKGHDVGVSAQEIQKVLPEIVKEKRSGYLGVQYEKIIPLLIESNKALLEENKKLEARIKRLEMILSERL